MASSPSAGTDVISETSPETSRPERWREQAVVGLALALIGIGAFFFLRSTDEMEGPRPRLLTDAEGRLELVVAHVNSARMSALRNAALVTEIANALPLRAEMLLTVNDPEAFTIARNPWPDRIQFVNLAGDKSYTIWPQDPFLVVERADGTKELLVSYEFERADDRTFPETLAGSLGWPARTSSLSFEGGNLVSDEKTIFIGANTIRLNAVRLGETDGEVARRFELELGKSVLVVGPLPQPVGHIDMMLTPLGRGRIAVGDPGLGARIAREEIEDRPEAVRAFEEECENEFFGDPSIRSVVDSEGRAIEPPSVVGRTAAVAAASAKIAAELDGVAQALAGRGYIVERIPLLADEPAFHYPGDVVGPGYPTLTYNNVLLETSPDEAIVYLPRYGFEALDERAREAWTELGFRVVSVVGLTVSSMYGGSLRCCVKVLSRSVP